MIHNIPHLHETINIHKSCLSVSKEKGFYIDSSTIHSLRFLAVAEYLLSQDPLIFGNYMREASEILIALSKRGQHLKVSSYVEMFIPLCLGDIDLIKEYAYYSATISLKPARDFAPLFFLSYRKLINGQQLDYPIDEMTAVFAKKYKSYTGYGICFKAIDNKNISNFEEGMTLIMKYHKRLAATSSIHFLEDQLIALWPLGMVNLARLSGMCVQVNHPLIPADLIVPCQENQFVKQ